MEDVDSVNNLSIVDTDTDVDADGIDYPSIIDTNVDADGINNPDTNTAECK